VLTFPLSLLPAGILEAGLMFDGYPNGRTFQTYESNIAFVLRFMIDKKMTGAAWLELAANKYEVVPDDQKVSHCQFELHAKYAPSPQVAVAVTRSLTPLFVRTQGDGHHWSRP
jgi:hypothetical protein